MSAARKLSLVGELPGANVKSYAGYLTVNKKYNSNLFFWFFPALMVGPHFCFTTGTSHMIEVLSLLKGGGGHRNMFVLVLQVFLAVPPQ